MKAKTTFPSFSDDSGCSWYELCFSKTEERQFLLEHHQDQNIIYNFLVCKAALTSVDLTVNGQNTFNTSFMC